MEKDDISYIKFTLTLIWAGVYILIGVNLG